MGIVVFKDFRAVNLRDANEQEFKKAADRFLRLARDRFNKAIAVTVVVDPLTGEQKVEFAVEEEIEEEVFAVDDEEENSEVE